MAKRCSSSGHFEASCNFVGYEGEDIVEIRSYDKNYNRNLSIIYCP